MDEQELIEAVLGAAGVGEAPGDRKRLSCAEAFSLAEKFGVEIIELGRICNEQDVRICKCQLGCFA